MDGALRHTVIPVGTVIGQLRQVDTVVPSSKIDSETVTVPTELDPGLIQFGDSPIIISSGRIDYARNCVLLA